MTISAKHLQPIDLDKQTLGEPLKISKRPQRPARHDMVRLDLIAWEPYFTSPTLILPFESSVFALVFSSDCIKHLSHKRRPSSGFFSQSRPQERPKLRFCPLATSPGPWNGLASGCFVFHFFTAFDSSIISRTVCGVSAFFASRIVSPFFDLDSSRPLPILSVIPSGNT